MPALDDEFVKDVSEFDTVEEYKKSVKTELENKKKQEAEAQASGDALEAVADSVEAVIPDCMIEKKIDRDIDDFAYRLQMQGLDIKTYFKYTGTDEKSIRDSYREQAVKQVKLDLAVEEIIKKEKLEVTPEDLEDEYKKYADAYNMDIEQIKKAVPADNIKPEILNRKAVDFIVENAVFTEEKAESKKSAAKAESGEKKPAAKKITAKKPAAKKAEE